MDLLYYEDPDTINTDGTVMRFICPTSQTPVRRHAAGVCGYYLPEMTATTSDQEFFMATKPKRDETAAAGRSFSALPSTNAVLVRFDADNTEQWFSNSNVEALRKWKGSEADLITEALKLDPGYTPEELIREGTRLLAKRLIAIARTPKRKTAARGVDGQADKRLATACAQLEKQIAKAMESGDVVTEITPYYLAGLAKTGSRTAARWMKRNRPDLLVAG